MAIFRIHKNENFTTISNYHLNDKRMSAKAKHYLTLMLSFSNDFEFNMEFLIGNCTDGKDAVKSAINELEKFGYITKARKSSGNLKNSYEFTVYEMPLVDGKMSAEIQQNPIAENQTSGKLPENTPNPDEQREVSRAENQTSPIAENPLQTNTIVYISKKENSLEKLESDFDKRIYTENVERLSGAMQMQRIQLSLHRENLKVSSDDYKNYVLDFMGEMIGTDEYKLNFVKLQQRFFYWLRIRVKNKKNQSFKPQSKTSSTNSGYYKRLG